MKKRILIVAVLAALLGAFVAVIILLRIQDTETVSHEKVVLRETVDIRYGDSFAELSFEDAEGNSVGLAPEQELCCVFYLSDSCTSCADVVRNINKLMAIINSEYVSYRIVWKDDMPMKLINEYGIPLNLCYLLTGNIEPIAVTPTMYILDASGNVIYYDSNMDHAIEKLYSLNIEYYDNAVILQNNANTYLIEQCYNSDSEKELLIYFKMEGCSDCVTADRLLEEAGLADQYDIVNIYKYNDTDMTHVKDDYGIFRCVYQINWYPSFLRIDHMGEAKFIGECPENKIIEYIIYD